MHATDIDWYAAGRRDWDLSLVTGTHDDDDPRNEASLEEGEALRAQIPGLGADQLRDYLTGFLEESDAYFWGGI